MATKKRLLRHIVRQHGVIEELEYSVRAAETTTDPEA